MRNYVCRIRIFVRSSRTDGPLLSAAAGSVKKTIYFAGEMIMLRSTRPSATGLIAAALCAFGLLSPTAPTLAATCSSEQWQPPAPEAAVSGVQQLLKAVPLGTKWVDLPETTRRQLQQHADGRLAAFRVRWAADALSQKETILLDCPTAEMSAAMDDFYRKSYAILAADFSLKDVKNAAFRRALVSNYLGSVAALRATLTYPDGKRPNRDWDGESLFDSTRLPDQQAYWDIKAFNLRVATDLRKIDDAALDVGEKALKQDVLFDSRAHSVGAFSRDSFGGGDMESACELIALNNDVVQGYKGDQGRPKIFADDGAVLHEVNAMYLHNTKLKWLDVGNVASAPNPDMLCRGSDDDLETFVGKPANNEIAKGIVQLREWWIERLLANPDSRNKCSVYSAADRAAIWEAFSADQRSNNDGATSMNTYMAQVERYRDSKVKSYRGTAKIAIQLVFPDDSLLSPAQRQQVMAVIDTETAFGRFPNLIATALDVAQGTTDGAAASAWKKAIATNVVYFQGGYSESDPVRPEDEATIRAMYDEVRRWVADQYRGYPINIASLFDKFTFTVTTGNNAATATSTGNITFGVGANRSRMEYYSILLHELRHAVAYAWRAANPNASSVIADVGPVVEGSGVAVEDLLLETFLRQALKSDLAYSLYALDYGRRDARFVATTDATLQKYFRPGCHSVGDVDGLEFAKAIVLGYGLPDKIAANQALRAHVGTQYFQYIAGGRQVVEDIAYLQAQIDPNGKARVDPFVLFACSLNNPRRDSTYIAALRTCMKL
jgi:hypothetical protein